MSAFIFLDEILELVGNERLTATFTLKGDEEFLLDHFKDFPVMPGVLLLEALKQASSRLLVKTPGFSGPFFRLAEVSDVKFGQFVKPASRLEISTRLVETRERRATMEGRIDLVSEGGSRRKALTASLVLEPAG